MRRFLVGAIVLIAALWLSAPITTNAQQDYPAPPTANNNTGLQAYGSFDSAQENISLGTGNLNIFIPLLSLPGRGGLDFKIGAVYDSNFWGMHDTWIQQANEHNFNWQTNPTIGFNLWRIAIPTLTYQYAFEGNQGGGTAPGPIYCVTNFVLVMSDGTQHSFPNLRDCNYYGTNGPGSGIVNVFVGESADASFIRLDVTNAADIVATLKSGVKIHFNNYQATTGWTYFSSMVDTNGNEITSTTSGLNTTFEDTVGRKITISEGTPQTITYQDANGTSRTIDIGFTPSGGSDPVFPNPNATTAPCMLVNPPPTVVMNYETSPAIKYAGTGYLTIPDGASGLAYSFTYDNFGHLTKISYPSGGYTRYDYTQWNGSTVPFAGGQCNTVSAFYVSARYQCKNSSGSCSSEDTTTYTHGTGDLDVIDSTPAKNRTHYIFAYGGTSGSGETVHEIERQYYAGQNQLLKTVTTAYTNCLSAPGGAVNDCDFPATITTTLNDVTPNLTSKVVYTYYSIPVPTTTDGVWNNGVLPIDNPLTITEYGYDGSVIRQTTNTWLNSGVYVENQLHILDRKTSTIVTDGSGSNWSKTTFEYDNYTAGIGSSGAIQHLSETSGRGNLTATQRWQNQSTALPVTRNQYDDAGNILSTTDPLGHTVTYSYTDSWGNTACQPPSGNTAAAYRYSVTNALNQTAYLAYFSCSGGVYSSKDGNGNVTYTTYDALNRITSMTYPDTGKTTVVYKDTIPFSVQTTEAMTSSTNFVTTEILDGYNRKIQSQVNSDPLGVTYVDTTYDPKELVSSVSNEYRSTSDVTYGLTSYSFDALSREIQETEADGSAIGTAYAGNTVTRTDEAGNQRKSQFDSLGRQTSVWEAPSTLNYLTTYTYDALGNLTKVVQNGSHPRTYVYDSVSRLTSATNPESGSIAYTYDAGGNVLTRKDARGITTTYGYDADNRITSKSYTDGTPTASFLYDTISTNGVTCANAIGRLSRSSQGVVESLFSYDKMGRVVTYWQTTPTHNSIAFTTTYGYDLAGDVTSFNNGLGTILTYTIDSARRVTGVNGTNNPPAYPPALVTVDPTIGYFPNGGVRKATYADGLTESIVVTPRWQPCRMSINSSGTGLQLCNDAIPTGSALDMVYGFNAGSTDNGNLALFEAQGNERFFRRYTYDALNRLATMSDEYNGCTGMSETYDAWGNRIAQYTTSGSCLAPQTPVDANNHFTSAGFSYDASGNLTADPSHTYAFDAENHLTKVDGGSTAVYTYDAANHRVEKTTSAGTTDYLYDLAGNVEGEWNAASASPSAQYVYWNNGLIANYVSGGIYMIHRDYLGSTRLVVAAQSRFVADRMDYSPFGEQIGGGNTVTHKFDGKERDAESNLDNSGARYYASTYGRFESADPLYLELRRLDDPQQLNLYQFAKNNPLRYGDPTGLDITCEGARCDDYLKRLRLDVSFKIAYDKNGKVVLDGDVDKKSLSKADKVLLAAINDDKHHVTINAIDGGKTAGIFFGSSDAPHKGTHTIAFDQLALLDAAGLSSSRVVGHETVEGYEESKGYSYEDAHNEANKYFGGFDPPTDPHAPGSIGVVNGAVVRMTGQMLVHGTNEKAMITITFTTPVPLPEFRKAEKQNGSGPRFPGYPSDVQKSQ